MLQSTDLEMLSKKESSRGVHVFPWDGGNWRDFVGGIGAGGDENRKELLIKL
jgi:hypothetical protein